MTYAPTLPVAFDAVFATIPVPSVVLDRELRYVAVNDAYLAVVGRKRDDLVGRALLEAFPEEGENASRLEASLHRARDEGVTDVLPLIPYAIATAKGGMRLRYWSATHTPIRDASGTVTHVLQQTQDVTDVYEGGEGLAERAPALAMLGHDVLRRFLAVKAEADDLRRLFMHAPGFMAVLRGPNHAFELVNNAYQKLVGGRRDLIGKPLREALPEIEAQGFLQILDNVRANGQPFIGRGMRLMLRKEAGEAAEEHFLDFIYQPITEADGSVSGIFIEGQDVTEQIRAQESQRVLIDELNHRVKNTLATVQAIASQTAKGSTSPADFARTFQGRLGALSRTHNVLTRSQWQGADLRELVEQELAAFEAGQVSVGGHPLHLPPRAALALGLVFHELATNAARHGALSADGGRLDVNWGLEAAGAGGGTHRLVIEWNESGGPGRPAPAAKGFGTRLIERSIMGELGGELHARHHDGCFDCRFTIPLPEKAA